MQRTTEVQRYAKAIKNQTNKTQPLPKSNPILEQTLYADNIVHPHITTHFFNPLSSFAPSAHAPAPNPASDFAFLFLTLRLGLTLTLRLDTVLASLLFRRPSGRDAEAFGTGGGGGTGTAGGAKRPSRRPTVGPGVPGAFLRGRGARMGVSERRSEGRRVGSS